MALGFYVEWIAAIGAMLGGIAASATFILLYKQLVVLEKQLKGLNESVESSTYQHIYEMMIGLDKFFFEHPQFRAYIYDKEPPEGLTPEERLKLDSVAEMMIDYFDTVFHQGKCMPAGTFPMFLNYMQEICTDNPVLNDFIGAREEWYPKKFIKHLRGGQKKSAPTEVKKPLIS